jgi:hypothetical protein
MSPIERQCSARFHIALEATQNLSPGTCAIVKQFAVLGKTRLDDLKTTIEPPGATLDTGGSISKQTSVGFSLIPGTSNVKDRWCGGSLRRTLPCQRTVPLLETSSTGAPADHADRIVPQHAFNASWSVNTVHNCSGVAAMWIMYDVCRSVMMLTPVTMLSPIGQGDKPATVRSTSSV